MLNVKIFTIFNENVLITCKVKKWPWKKLAIYREMCGAYGLVKPKLISSPDNWTDTHDQNEWNEVWTLTLRRSDGGDLLVCFTST